jgi:hypothetical protein
MAANGNGRMDTLTRVAVAIFVLLALIVGATTFVIFYPFHPVVYSKTVLEQGIVKAGSYVTYTAYFKKNVTTIGTMTRYLVSLNGEATITLDPPGLADAKFTDTTKTVIVYIPSFVKPGLKKIRWVVVYPYYGIRQVSVSHETPVFTVIPFRGE